MNVNRLMVLPLACAAGSTLAEPARYEIDPAHTVIAFMAGHIGFARVLGTFSELEGAYIFDEETGQVSDVRVVVDTASVATNDEDRDEHLRSDDFLDTGEHSSMTFVSDSVRHLGDGEYEVSGQLTLLGITRPLTLEATLNKIGDYPLGRNAYAMGVSASGVLQRSDFGIDYALDNGWVGNDVEIIIEFEAQRQ